MKIIGVFHTDKVEEGLDAYPNVIRANPTLSLPGMDRAHHTLAYQLAKEGPFAAMYSSRLARAADMASVFALYLNLDFQTLKGLGQHSSKDKHGSHRYPGYEDEGPVQWQEQAVAAVQKIAAQHQSTDTVLVASHRPILCSLVAYADGYTDEEHILSYITDGNLTNRPWLVLEVKKTIITFWR